MRSWIGAGLDGARRVPDNPRSVTLVLVTLAIPLAILYGFDIGRPYTWFALRVVVMICLIAQLRGWGKPLEPPVLALILVLTGAVVATFFLFR
jgi:hypothetical protein